MKQKYSSKKVISWLGNAGAKALVVLLIVTAGSYAYAAISWPNADPNPVSGVVGTFVGESGKPYKDNIVGYVLANLMCADSYQGSHICTTAEMTNSYNNGVAGVSPIFAVRPTFEPDPVRFPRITMPKMLWVNASSPSNINPTVNDCNGWNDHDGAPYYGTVWNFETESPAMQPCDISKATIEAIRPLFACCK